MAMTASSTPAAAAAAAAFLSTLLISLAPNLILLLFPNYAASASGERQSSWVLSIGQALAAGGLLGDVFLHTLPHSMGGGHGHGHGDSHGHSHSHGDDGIGLTVLIGFGTFLVFDIMVRAVGGEQHHHHHGHGEAEAKADGRSSGGGGSHGAPASAKATAMQPLLNSTILLNLAADALHNFTDGLAIGASFAASASDGATVLSLLQSRGALASLSILFHEIPHELGDFAILVSNGLSKRQAIMAQFSTAVAAFAGTALGLVAASFDDKLGHEVLLPFTAGGFVYLAAVSILPEILDERSVGFWVRSAQILAFGLGVAFMQAVAVLEGMDEAHGGGHHRGEHGHQHAYHDGHEHRQEGGHIHDAAGQHHDHEL